MAVMKRLEDWQLAVRQKLPLEVKERMAMERIARFIDEYGEENVYNSFSGGKDSTVQKHLTERVSRRVSNVYLDTWLEYPSVRRFVKGCDNVITLKPLKSMKEIVKECGWCFPSKEAADMIYYARRGSESALKKLKGLNKNGERSEFREQYKKYWKLYDSDIPISKFCCDWQKEMPVKLFEKEFDMHPIVALKADESGLRKQAYLKAGCLTFDTVKEFVDGEVIEKKNSRPMCRPIEFFTDQDIFQYILKYNLPYAEEYGEIIPENGLPGQCSMLPSECHRLRCTGEQRTGCCLCPVGMHLDKMAKFERLKKKEPKLYDYCMEELGEKRLVEWVKLNMI